MEKIQFSEVHSKEQMHTDQSRRSRSDDGNEGWKNRGPKKTSRERPLGKEEQRFGAGGNRALSVLRQQIE